MLARRTIQCLKSMNKNIQKEELSGFVSKNLRIALVQGDITNEQTDVIVNAANNHLKHVSGLAAAISKQGGPEIQKESDSIVEKHGIIRTGECTVTGHGKLKCRHLFHAVGPIFSGHSLAEAEYLLKGTVKNCFRKARELNCASMAFPAISSGVFGYPNHLCAEHILEEIISQSYMSNMEYVRIVIFDNETIEAFSPVFHEFKEKYDSE